MAAQDVLEACDEEVGVGVGGSASVAGADSNLANPALGLLRGIRHRNMAAIKWQHNEELPSFRDQEINSTNTRRK